MTQEDVLHRCRLGTMALAERLGNVRQACQVLGIHPWTYYRWRRDFERYGPEALRRGEAAAAADAERDAGAGGAAGGGGFAGTPGVRSEAGGRRS